jgi:DNA-binding NarL/FixJ family response regulator
MDSIKHTMIVADDHPILQQAIARGVGRRAGFEVVACVDDLESAIEACRLYQPDVLLLDIEMPGGSAFDAVDRVREAAPGCRVVIFTAHSSRDFVELARSKSPEGYLLKDDGPEVLVEALRELMRTGRAYSERVREGMTAGV